MKRFPLFICALLTLYACKQAGETSQTEQKLVIDQVAKERLDATLQSLITDSMVVGASALIFEKGKEVYFNAFGHADREAGVPMGRNTIATIYSMTKPISGTTLMTLYEQGKFQLEDELATYAPEFADMQVVTSLDESGEMVLEPANRAITIADITRHTAGFSRRSDLGLDTFQGEVHKRFKDAVYGAYKP